MYRNNRKSMKVNNRYLKLLNFGIVAAKSITEALLENSENIRNIYS